MTSNAPVVSSSLANGNMANTLTSEWFYTLFNQRYALQILWTGTPTGTLYIDIGAGTGAPGQQTISVTTIDYLTSMAVASGVTTSGNSFWSVSGANDWEYIRVRWVPTGTTTGTLVSVRGCLKSQG